MSPPSNAEDDDNTLEQLVVILEAIEIDRLKQVSYRKYVNQLFDVSRRSISIDGARLSLIIQHIKSYQEPCFHRDVMLDVLDMVLSQCLPSILVQPFKSTSSNQWSELACSIAAIPDLIANCKFIDKFPHLRTDPYYNRLIEQVCSAIELKSITGGLIPEAYKLFLLKLLGRIALSGYSHTIWDKFTRRALNESRPPVKNLYRDILQLAIKPPSPHTTLELFIDHLILPIFYNQKPSQNSASLINCLLAEGVIENQRLRYLICDKSILQTNYDISREKQSNILFNIAAYLSSFVTSNKDSFKSSDDGDVNGESLLVKTLMDIVLSWTNPTKILIRTYAHGKYITLALLVFYRYSSRHDGRRLASLALKIQSMIINSLPIYLNRVAPEQRNLACCLCELILPKLRDDIVKKEQNQLENEDLHLNFKVDLDDDLRHLRQLFVDDIEVLFPCVSDDSQSIAIEADGRDAITTVSIAGRDEEKPSHRQGRRQLGGKSQNQTSDIVGDDKNVSSGSKDSPPTDQECVSSTARAQCDEQDLIPYEISESDDSDDDDEFELGNDVASVPIYLSDCITGLIENNNHRYVRLCLIRAGALIDSLIDGKDADDALKGRPVCLAQHSTGMKPYGTSIARGDRNERSEHVVGVNDTIRDLGVELARTLLFVDNQHNIDRFDEYRAKCLTSLCFAAPGLVGKYLIDELNGTNRSMRQQIDILSTLVAAAQRLSTSSGLSDSKSIGANQMKLVKFSRKGINRFAPFASLFFYGISHRLKADVSGSQSLITTLPQSIMSSFRERIDDSHRPTQSTLKGMKSGELRTGSKLDRMVLCLDDDKEEDEVRSKKFERGEEGDIDKFLEQNSISDDSYLLSRILLSISNILSCSAQQPVTCKFSSDLLDILSAYRCHPDSGVQRAIVSCLKMIRDCTPSTYYSSYIEQRMLRSFGPWLANIEPNVQR